MATEELNVDPAQLRANIDAIINNVHGMHDVTDQFNFDITKNTCTNIVDFKTEMTSVKTKCGLYTTKFQQNLSKLLECVGIVEDMDAKIAAAVDSNSAAEKARAAANAAAQPASSGGNGASDYY